MGSAERRSSGGADQLLGGRYRLGGRLGSGGAATVHTAVDLVLGREVAVKRYQPMGSATGVHRFAAEARLLASLSHPGLVTVYDVCLEDDQPYLVMQLINGPTLRDVLDRGPLPPDVTARFGARLADVLAYIHANDVVHRDIKPSNVLIDETGACHLADFGLARALSAAHLTATGEFVGTAAYLAPEQVTDIDTGPPVDVYALGLLLLECLTGRTEYTGTTVEVAVARLSRQPRIPESFPPVWRTLLTAMTARDPAARPDATRCVDLLTRITEDPAPVGVVEPPPPPPVEALSSPPVEAPRARRFLAARPRPIPAGLTAVALAATVAAAVATSLTTAPDDAPRGESPTTDTRTVTPGNTAGNTDPTDDGIDPAAEVDSSSDSPTGSAPDSASDTPPDPSVTTTATTTDTEITPATEPTTTVETSTSTPPPDEPGGPGRRPSKSKGRDK